jgi:hypothetical protein
LAAQREAGIKAQEQEDAARIRLALRRSIEADPGAFVGWNPAALWQASGYVVSDGMAVAAATLAEALAISRRELPNAAGMRVPAHGGGRLVVGYFGRMRDDERCRHCGSPAVKGAGVCTRHGGGRLALQRVRERLAKARKPSVIAKCVARLERAAGNAARAHRDDVRRLAAEARNAEADRLQREAAALARIGFFDMDLLRRAERVALALRPYREADARIAAARLAWLAGRDVAWAVDHFALELSLTGAERAQALRLLAPVIGAAAVARIARTMRGWRD